MQIRHKETGAVLANIADKTPRMVNLAGADLRDADLSGLRFQTCDLTDTDLSGACLQDATFINCTLVRTQFAGADLTGASFETILDMSWSPLLFGYAWMAVVMGSWVPNAGTWPTLIAGALTACGLVSLLRSRFRMKRATGFWMPPGRPGGSEIAMAPAVCDTDFTGATMAGTRLGFIAPKGAVFQDTDWRGTPGHRPGLQRAIGLDFQRARLDGLDLRGVDFSQSDFRGASLTHCNLRGAFLAGANLAGADLRGADLTDALMAHATVEDAVYDGQTRWPSDFMYHRHGAVYEAASMTDAMRRLVRR